MRMWPERLDSALRPVLVDKVERDHRQRARDEHSDQAGGGNQVQPLLPEQKITVTRPITPATSNGA